MLKHPFRVYRNLSNGKISIVDQRTGRVVGHADSVTLAMPEFRVREAGRQRVIAERRKNVHAFVLGHIASVEGFESYKGRNLYTTLHWVAPTGRQINVTYNPFVSGEFRDRETGEPIHEAESATIRSTGHMTALV